MPISLKSTSSGICTGIQLSGAQPVPFVMSTNGCLYGDVISITNINISAALTQLCNVTVPAGKRLVLLDAQFTALGTNSAFTIEVEIDGTVVLSHTANYSNSNAYLVGGSVVNEKLVEQLAVDSSLKIRAMKPSSTAISFTLSYILVSN